MAAAKMLPEIERTWAPHRIVTEGNRAEVQNHGFETD
jgi:hypothetical protein